MSNDQLEVRSHMKGPFGRWSSKPKVECVPGFSEELQGCLEETEHRGENIGNEYRGVMGRTNIVRTLR